MPCSICYSDDYQTWFSEQRYSIVRCNHCGFLYLNPRPIKSNNHQPVEDLTFLQQFNLMNKNQKIIFFRERLAEIARYKKHGRLLDVGCGTGTFLEVANRAGYVVMGVESSRWAIEYMRINYNFPVYYGMLRDAKLADESQDIIVMWDSLEHVPDPAKTITEVYRILDPDGILAISVPNLKSMLSLSRNANALKPDMHLSYFSYRTLKKLIEDRGFRMVDYKTVQTHKFSEYYEYFKEAYGIGDRQVDVERNSLRRLARTIGNLLSDAAILPLRVNSLRRFLFDTLNFNDRMVVIARKA